MRLASAVLLAAAAFVGVVPTGFCAALAASASGARIAGASYAMMTPATPGDAVVTALSNFAERASLEQLNVIGRNLGIAIPQYGNYSTVIPYAEDIQDRVVRGIPAFVNERMATEDGRSIVAATTADLAFNPRLAGIDRSALTRAALALHEGLPSRKLIAERIARLSRALQERSSYVNELPSPGVDARSVAVTARAILGHADHALRSPDYGRNDHGVQHVAFVIGNLPGLATNWDQAHPYTSNLARVLIEEIARLGLPFSAIRTGSFGNVRFEQPELLFSPKRVMGRSEFALKKASLFIEHRENSESPPADGPSHARVLITVVNRRFPLLIRLREWLRGLLPRRQEQETPILAPIHGFLPDVREDKIADLIRKALYGKRLPPSPTPLMTFRHDDPALPALAASLFQSAALANNTGAFDPSARIAYAYAVRTFAQLHWDAAPIPPDVAPNGSLGPKGLIEALGRETGKRELFALLNKLMPVAAFIRESVSHELLIDLLVKIVRAHPNDPSIYEPAIDAIFNIHGVDVPFFQELGRKIVSADLPAKYAMPLAYLTFSRP